MFRLIACFLYMSGYLLYSVPHLIRMKHLSEYLPVSERDRIIHFVPKKWSRTIMKITGSQIIVEGTHLIPDGPVVFIANHEGNFDIPVLLGSLEKPFGFVSKVEVKKFPILSAWMEAINCVFLDRKDRRQAINSIKEGVKMIKEGHSMVIFPEGTRSKGGPVSQFKAGSFRLAKDAGVPIVPISIKGTSDVFEKNGRFVRPAVIEVTVGQPLQPYTFSAKDIKELADEVREIIISNRNECRLVS